MTAVGHYLFYFVLARVIIDLTPTWLIRILQTATLQQTANDDKGGIILLCISVCLFAR